VPNSSIIPRSAASGAAAYHITISYKPRWPHRNLVPRVEFCGLSCRAERFATGGTQREVCGVGCVTLSPASPRPGCHRTAAAQRGPAVAATLLRCTPAVICLAEFVNL
jgi:hypothetical protein